jgi:hypothetical protein
MLRSKYADKWVIIPTQEDSSVNPRRNLTKKSGAGGDKTDKARKQATGVVQEASPVKRKIKNEMAKKP